MTFIHKSQSHDFYDFNDFIDFNNTFDFYEFYNFDGLNIYFYYDIVIYTVYILVYKFMCVSEWVINLYCLFLTCKSNWRQMLNRVN